MTSLPTHSFTLGRVDQRASPRLKFKGAPFAVRVGKKRTDIRLKDLSSGGAAGLMEEPVAVGEYVMIELDAQHQLEALVCWVRRVMVGLSFVHTLSPAFVEHFHEQHGGRLGFDEDVGRLEQGFRAPKQSGWAA